MPGLLINKILDRLKSFFAPDFFWILLVAAGLLLRLRQYFVNRSLWVDEASLALNIADRSFGALTHPLDYDQGAPVGFLFIEKFIILILGNRDYILRLFPIFSGLFSVYLLYRIAREHFGKSGLLAVFLFSVSTPLVYLSSELKQYSSDVMLALLLTCLATPCLRQEPPARHFILLGLAGFLSIWISHPSAFILAGIGLLLAVEKLLKKACLQFRWILGMGMAWGGAFLSTYLVSLRYMIDNKYLQDYWRNHFMPLPPWAHPEWYERVLISLLPEVSPSFLPNIDPNFRQDYLIEGCFVLILIGILSLFWRSPKIAFLTLSPFLMASIASVLHRYPLSGRFLHFLLPFVILFIAEGLGRVYSLIAGVNAGAALLVYASAAFVILWTPVSIAFHNAFEPPMGEDIKPVLAYIQAQMQENDIIYVHNGSVNPFTYYASAYGLDTNNTFVAKKSTNVKRFIVDVEYFDGNPRVWFIFSHVISCDCSGDSGDRVQFHVRILDEYGVQQDRFEASRAAAYLYNLSP